MSEIVFTFAVVSKPGNAVYLIGFGESEVGPHMAPDNKYYIRGGAHTVPAGHFIVEAIHARRGMKRPILRTLLRRKPEGGGIIQLGIVALTDAPALDVEIELNSQSQHPGLSVGKLSLQIAVINVEMPFFFDVHISTTTSIMPPPLNLQLKYRDLAGRSYEESPEVDAARQIPPFFGGSDHLRGIEDRLRDIERALKAR